MKILPLALILFCAALPVSAVPERHPADSVSGSAGVHVESLWAQSVMLERRLEYQGRFFFDVGLDAYLHEILEKLTTPKERAHYNFRIQILKNGEFNAFAAPDGTIYLNTGLLSRLTNETQVAAVLGHEVGHIVNRHTERNLIALKTLSRLMALEANEQAQRGAGRRQRRASKRQSDALPMSGGVTGNVTSASLEAAIYGYTQDIEREADSTAIVRMAAAGYLQLDNFRQFIDGIINYRGGRCVAGGGCREDEIEAGFLSIKLRNVILYDVVANFAAGNFDLVETQLERLLSVDSSDVDVLLIRGDMERIMSPRSTASIKWYEKALRHEPDNVVAIRALGFAYHSMGVHDKAREYLQRYSDIAGEGAADIKMVREALGQ
ncbi:MAG: M48 family metalloprotease [Chitinispirillales bacterium]|jgi:predicted Zn-dependent protease|nr:M48 family metalloprotease [Chitinispirillales bacterium]